MLDIYAELCDLLGEDQVKVNEAMSRHTTFGVGGPARYFVIPKNEVQIKSLIIFLRKIEINYAVLGNGSNLLVGDKGYLGVIVYMGEPWKYCKMEGNLLTAGAGISLPKLAREAYSYALTGLEFAAGIPGSLGGSVVMNAGAYGSEMKNVIQWAKVLTPDGELRILEAKELELGYRTSCIRKNNYVVLEAQVKLSQSSQKQIKALMDDLSERRRSKQPLEYPSAGSTFQRPEGYFAGKLIEDAGLRGYCVGGAQVSEKHCGFVINKDKGTAADIVALCEDVKAQVKEQFGVELQMEVKKLGDF